MNDTRTNTRQVGQFDMAGSDGKTYQVTANQEFTRHRYMDNSWSKETPGRKSFELADGTEVYQMSDGTFQIDGSGVVLSSED